MVKQQLWVVNSSLLIIFCLTLLLGVFLQQATPPFRIKRPTIDEFEKPKPLSKASIESIYKNDLFGTFIPTPHRAEPQSLITPIPQPRAVDLPTPPPAAKPEFVPPLALSLKGIAFSLDEDKSIGMLTDETQKENIYHLGDPIKDALLLKIARNRITLLRSNGQHETIFLRKEDNPQEDNPQPLPPAQQWNHVIKKVEENSFLIDRTEFPKAFPTLGSLIQAFSLLTIYRDGKPVGIKIGNNLAPNSLGTAMGLVKGDIIMTINSIKTANKKNRITIYDKAIQMKKEDSLSIELERNQQPFTLTYKLTHIEKELKGFFPTSQPDQPKQEAPQLKMSQLQAREERTRKFAQQHPPRQEKAIEEIRQRLLENMRARARNTRVR